MSRMLVFGILGILLVLLGVMGFVVNPRPKGPPSAEETAQKQQMVNKMQEQEMKQRQERMKVMIDKQKDLEAKLGKEKALKAAGHMPPQAASVPAPVTSAGMDISSDWYHHQPDGSKGLSKLEAVSKQQAEADRNADQARASLFTGGNVGPGLDKVKHLPIAKAPEGGLVK